ncbi:hypothetical protein HWV62_43549 [Athelia sp. TMB]|nr:hypothetical protein HWV62_43549 [Athelia sp. TMB]
MDVNVRENGTCQVAEITTSVDWKHDSRCGGQAYTFTESEVARCILPGFENHLADIEDAIYVYVDHVDLSVNEMPADAYIDLVPVRIPLYSLAPKLNMAQLLSAVRIHGIKGFIRNTHIDVMREALSTHSCDACTRAVTLLKCRRKRKAPARFGAEPENATEFNEPARKKPRIRSRRSREQPTIGASAESHASFPPEPINVGVRNAIIEDWCDAHMPENFEELGCAVCGQLVKKKGSMSLNSCEAYLHNLHGSDSATRQERFSHSEPVKPLSGPVLDKRCYSVCEDCNAAISNGKIPMMALANGLWIGEVPSELQDLYYAEKMLIARVRHNRCVVRVKSGMHKMHANVISFANPTVHVYDTLPPPRSEIEDVISFIFVGPCKPTKRDLERTPMIVRRDKVSKALEWLKLNNQYYAELTISYENLAEYADYGSPVTVAYRETNDTEDTVGQAANHNEGEDGTNEGRCSLVIQGLEGSDFGNKSWEEMTAIAVEHLTMGGGSMAVSHHENPQSIYHNPGLYPQMFPWLFPFGKGGLDNPEHYKMISTATHKKWMLMYWDKRFQEDPHFPIVALNHEQIKSSVNGGFLMAKKNDFRNMSERLLNLDLAVMKDLSKRLQRGERINNRTPAQNECFRIMHDLDLIGKHVQGSRTIKKFMRNEIWSLIEFLGAPSWFITFAPSDHKSPVCLYYADKNVEFRPEILPDDVRFRMIATNPVAGARFFDFVVKTFIRCVLGVGLDRQGLFGETSAYYGTVEQQGRLTLHLHLLLWIRGALTPQEIRDRIMDPDGEFQKRMVRYLETAHQGEYKTGKVYQVAKNVSAQAARPGYEDPTMTLPSRPKRGCDVEGCMGCVLCNERDEWEHRKDTITDDILFRSNYHKCGKRCYEGGRSTCKSRFPRDTYDRTLMDPNTGALSMKKVEPDLNTFNYTLSYLLRSNSDVTSLLSGTALKAVVAYVTEYITKLGLKTYGVLDTIHSVIGKNLEMIGGSNSDHDKSRKLMTQVVNSLTSKSEIGGPMAALYLLENPDHYTSHIFRPCYWKNYVREAMRVWDEPDSSPVDSDPINDTNGDEEKVVIGKSEGQYIGISKVDDYVKRPTIYEDVPLYTWIRLANVEKISRRDQKKSKAESTIDDDEDSDSTDSDAESDTPAEQHDGSEMFAAINSHQFITGHPLRKTHRVVLAKDDKLVVPNFIGGNLPRSDKGDRESYCATMLALFKPWRNGYDLKNSEQNWDDAFDEHVFSAEAVEKMKFFHVKYECADARDDFHAQRKAAEKDSDFQWTGNGDDGGDIDDEDYDTGIEQELINLFDTESKDSIRHRRKIKRELDEIKTIMMTAGWFDNCVDGNPDSDISINMDTGELPKMSPGRWQNAVQSKKQQVIAGRRKHIPTTGRRRIKNVPTDIGAGEVKIVGKEFLNHRFKAALTSHQELTDNIVAELSLNKEQERAFRIVANHASDRTADRLQMYLGGMGGTGKSTVIKALVRFFHSRNEAHRFIIVAPTGAAAALLNGSTYHSVFGINDRNDDNKGSQFKQVAQIRSSLDGVEYVFLDEVSMLGCRSMYGISAAAAKALGVPEEAFGGLNMIFAGDFAQLAPVKAQALYSGSVGTRVNSTMTLKEQEEAIGKALWHQTTVVVILRENMRQRTQSPDDNRLRTALENMRYKSCTEADIEYLRSRIAGRGPKKPKLAQRRFRNISVITARNIQKDQINSMGAARYAIENGMELTTFYSGDTLQLVA